MESEIKYKKDFTPANSNEMLAGSYIVTVDDYDNYSHPQLIDRSTFSKFAFKNGKFSESAQLDFKEYGTEFKTPQYPLDFLAGLLNLNIYHEECCDMVSTYTTKYGFDITTPDGLADETGEALRKQVFEWLYEMPTNLLDVITECAYDYEAIGCAGIEVIRESEAPYNIQYYKRFDVVNCKLTTDNKRVVQEIAGKRRYFTLYNYNLEHPTEQIEVDRFKGHIYDKGTLSADEVGHEVIWLRKYKTSMDNYGSSKISKALDVIETEVGRSNFIKKFFVNYGLPAFVVTVTGNFKQYDQSKYNPDGTLNPDYDETKTIEYQIGEKLKKMILNPYSAMVLTLPSDSNFGNEVKVDITPLNNDVKEASFRLLREDNKKDICSAHGMSSDIIGTTQVGSLGGNTLETDLNSFVTDKIRPIQLLFENCINPSFRERFDVNVKFTLNNSNAEDKDKKLERILKLGNAGLMTRKQQQQALGTEFNLVVDEEDEYLDEYLINGRTEEQIFELNYIGNYHNRYNYNYGGYSVNDGDLNADGIANKALNELETQILNEAYRLWCKDGEDGNISLKSETTQGIPENIKRIIRNYFKP